MADKKEPTLLELLNERRQKAFEAWSGEIGRRETADTDFEARRNATDEAVHPTDDEVTAHRDAQAAFRVRSDEAEVELREFDKRIDEQGEIETRRAAAAAASKGNAEVESEPLTYRRDNAHVRSYYADLAVAMVDGVTLSRNNKTEALTRLNRHAAEMDVEIPKRIKAAEARAVARFAEAESRSVSRRNGVTMEDVRPLAYDPFQRSRRGAELEERVTPNRQDGYGGYLIPPLWLPEDFIPGLRAQGVARDLCRQMDLPAGTDSINIPKLANLTAVGYQQADNSGVVTQDWTDTFVQANVKTAAGQSDVALQLLEQSPNGITDEVITTDLLAAYNQFVDQQVISGDGVSTGQLNGGHILGIYPSSNWANTNGVTYTDSSPAGVHFGAGAMGPLASKIARTRFDVEDFAIVMHGRRWFWYSTANDVNGRPLGETLGAGRFQAAVAEEELAAYGRVGTLPYLADAPVYIDNNIPITDTAGGGSAQDIAIGALWSDLWLFMGDLRTNVFREVLSGSLGVRFQVYNYFAFLARYGQSIAVATGSGFAQPSTGYGDYF
jgi:hypothetical protein